MTAPHRNHERLPAGEGSGKLAPSSRRSSRPPEPDAWSLGQQGAPVAGGAALIALVAHDLKPPLSAMAINLDFAFGELPADGSHEAVRCALDDCRAAAATALRLVADAMDAFRIAERELIPISAPLNAATLIGRAMATYADEACGRRVTLRSEADDVPVFADADLIRRVIENLIEVALRSSRAEGTVVVSAMEGEIEVRADSLAAGSITIPTAVAMEPAVARRNFGLYFSDVVMRAHGGRLLVSHESDGTARFHVQTGPRPVSSVSP